MSSPCRPGPHRHGLRRGCSQGHEEGPLEEALGEPQALSWEVRSFAFRLTSPPSPSRMPASLPQTHSASHAGAHAGRPRGLSRQQGSHAGAHAGRPRGLPRQQGLWFTPVLITARSQKHQLWGRTLPGGLWEGPVVTGGAPVRPAVPVAAPGPGFFWAAVSRPAPEPRGWTQLAWTPASGDKMQP